MDSSDALINFPLGSTSKELIVEFTFKSFLTIPDLTSHTLIEQSLDPLTKSPLESTFNAKTYFVWPVNVRLTDPSSTFHNLIVLS